MWREYHVFRCPACGWEKEEMFYRITGEALHDQWIDIEEQAERMRRLRDLRCPGCGHDGLEHKGPR
ncbi:MAG: hypothetical protein HY720_24675 [Planctomycetes bacterium]|nr:hypothetical protein [Planctomycetota bacterium]